MAISHANHDHPNTPAARAKCRKAMVTGCTRGPNCPVHPTCDGGCPPVGQVKPVGTVRLVGVEPRGRRRSTVNGGTPVAERRRFIRDEGDLAGGVPHVFSTAIRHAWHQGWTVQHGNPYNDSEKRIIIDNGHGDELELIYKAGQHHVNAVNYRPVKMDGDRRRGVRVGEAPAVATGLRYLANRATVSGPINNPTITEGVNA